MGLKDRITGRAKKAAGDLAGDDRLRRQGAREEAKADAREDLDRAHEQVEEQAARVQESERAVEEERLRRER
jgi:colicin import membrane protein